MVQNSELHEKILRESLREGSTVSLILLFSVLFTLMTLQVIFLCFWFTFPVILMRTGNTHTRKSLPDLFVYNWQHILHILFHITFFT